MSEHRPIILASSSTWRLKLLNDAGIPATSQSAQINEYDIQGSDPVDIALKRATAKAFDVASAHPEALVIGADQVVYLDGQLFEKPKSALEWRQRLRLLRGQAHHLSTAVTLVQGDTIDQFVETTLVYFRAEIDEAHLDAYVSHGEAWGCAGGYMMEGHGAWLIERIEGDWQNVIGLPIFPLITRLYQLGYRYPIHASTSV